MPREREVLVAAQRLGAAGHQREARKMIGHRDVRIGVPPRERAQRASYRVDRGPPVGVRSRLARLRMRQPRPRAEAPTDVREIHPVGREEDLDPVTPQR
jgi:ribosomal protein S4